MQKKMTNVIKFCLPANIPHVTMTKSIFYKIFMVHLPSIFWKRLIIPDNLRTSFVSMLLITH
ncbi:hypothetical protein DW813_14225 [Roseburia inulinivorans]|uniref:Uncharacterized protein n=1 Tax=Roseburia inulinivorans TaxID=360807 RepID=A0A396AF99_9FIRM|nr:hypothetical protein DW813_14225 [Roseburia inulinivorans]